MKKVIAIVIAVIFLLTVVYGTVTARGDENYNDHSWEGNSPNAQGEPQHPDNNGGMQQRAEPRLRFKDR